MLRVENLNTGYDKKQVLFDISFKITKGDIALFIGSNGSGKSTLLRSIYGLCRVWDGKVYFENENITNVKPHTLLQKGLLYIPQKNNVFEQLTVKENLEISGLILNDKSLFNKRLEQTLNYFPILVSKYKKHPINMSGGEKQQLVLGMAMLHKPKLLLIDEPFNGLSPLAIHQIGEHLLQLKQAFEVTILIVEHRLNEVLPIVNCLVALKLGKKIEDSKEMIKFTPEYLNQILI